MPGVSPPPPTQTKLLWLISVGLGEIVGSLPSQDPNLSNGLPEISYSRPAYLRLTAWKTGLLSGQKCASPGFCSEYLSSCSYGDDDYEDTSGSDRHSRQTRGSYSDSEPPSARGRGSQGARYEDEDEGGEEEVYEEEAEEEYDDGRGSHRGSGDPLYHSAEFPLGGNPAAGSERGSRANWDASTDDSYADRGRDHDRDRDRDGDGGDDGDDGGDGGDYGDQGSPRSQASYRSGSYREGGSRSQQRRRGGRDEDERYGDEDEEYYDDEGEDYGRADTYKRAGSFSRTGTFSRTMTFFGRSLTRTNTMSKNLSRNLTRTITRQYKFETEEEVEEAAAAMEEARRQRLERGDGALEDATTKVVENTTKLARTMTMAAAAPVVAVLENEQVQKQLNFFKERALTMAVGRPDWHPEPPKVPLPAACNCCSVLIIFLVLLLPGLLFFDATRQPVMSVYVTAIATPAGPQMPPLTLPPLGQVCSSGGFGAQAVNPGVKTMNSTWWSNALADGAQIQLQSYGNLWWYPQPPNGVLKGVTKQIPGAPPPPYSTPPGAPPVVIPDTPDTSNTQSPPPGPAGAINMGENVILDISKINAVVVYGEDDMNHATRGSFIANSFYVNVIVTGKGLEGGSYTAVLWDDGNKTVEFQPGPVIDSLLSRRRSIGELSYLKVLNGTFLGGNSDGKYGSTAQLADNTTKDIGGMPVWGTILDGVLYNNTIEITKENRPRFGYGYTPPPASSWFGGGGRRRLLQAPDSSPSPSVPTPASPGKPKPPAPPGAPAPPAEGTTGGFGAYGRGPLGLNTNTAPGVDEFFTVVRVNKTAFRLKAPNGSWLTVSKDGTLVATQTGKTPEGIFSAEPVASALSWFVFRLPAAPPCRPSLPPLSATPSLLTLPAASPNCPTKPHVNAPLRFSPHGAATSAEKYSIRIYLSMHSAPGGQNHGSESSSRDGAPDWQRYEGNINKTLDCIEWLASRYSKSPALFGIGLLNEPNTDMVPLGTGGSPSGRLKQYMLDAYSIIRKYSPCAFVGISPLLGQPPATDMAGFMTNALDHNNVMIDVHYYNVFDLDINTNPSFQAHIDYVRNQRATELKALSEGDRTVLVGEWSLALPEFVGAKEGDYGVYSQTQLEVYNNASAGWFFWSFKVDKDSHGVPNWAMITAQNKGWLTY
ncbi:unnamed protein product [Closterium sp. NIES-54]